MTIANLAQRRAFVNGIDSVDVALIGAFVANATVAEAAKVAGVSPTEVHRRMSRPGFRVALGEAKLARWKPDAERLRAEVKASIDYMVALRDDPEASRSMRLRAAERLIDYAMKLNELVEYGARLAALEAALAGADGGDVPSDEDLAAPFGGAALADLVRPDGAV